MREGKFFNCQRPQQKLIEVVVVFQPTRDEAEDKIKGGGEKSVDVLMMMMAQ